MTDDNTANNTPSRPSRMFLIILLAAFTLIIAFFITLMPPMGQQTEVVGTVEDLVTKTSEIGNQYFLSIRLESGEVVSSYVASEKYFLPGKRVRLTKKDPVLFGNSMYIYREFVKQ